MNKKYRIIIAVAVGILLLLVYGVWHNKRSTPKVISYKDFLQEIEENRVEKVFLNDGPTIHGILKDDTEFITDNPRKEGFKEELLIQGIMVQEKRGQEFLNQTIAYAIMMGLLILDYYIFQIRHLKLKGRLQGFRNVHKTEESVKVKFSNIAGNEEAVHSVEELIDFIHNPENILNMGPGFQEV